MKKSQKNTILDRLEKETENKFLNNKIFVVYSNIEQMAQPEENVERPMFSIKDLLEADLGFLSTHIFTLTVTGEQEE